MQVAIVGSGSISARYKSIFEKSFGVSPVVVSNYFNNSSRNSIISREEFACSNYSHGHFDLLIIASENKKHLDDYFMLNSFAKKILFEKPLLHRVLNDYETKNLMKRENDIFISSPLRFHEGFVEMLENRKKIGEASNIEVRCQSWLPNWRPTRNYKLGFWNDPEQGGVLREVIHEFDYLIRMFGTLVPVYSSLSTSNFLSLKVESSADVYLKTSTNEKLNVHLDFSSAISRRYFRIDGISGSLHWDLLQGKITGFYPEGPTKIKVFEGDLDRNLTFQRQITSIFNHESWPISSTNLKEGLSTLQLIDKISSLNSN